MTLDRDFRDFIELLNRHSVEYLVVGGYAMAFHGRPRYTGDIDIWINISVTNAEKMVSVIAEFGFSSLGFTKHDFLQDNLVNQIGYPPLRIDILTAIDGITFDEAYRHKKEIEIDSIPVAFIGLNQLIENKRASNRQQDMADILSLQKKGTYSLAIMPDPAIAADVAEMKLKLKTAIGKSYGSANAEAHISLDGFDAAEADYPLILAEYARVVAELTPFNITFSGLGDYDRGNFSAFYVKPTEDSALEIVARGQAVARNFDKKLKKQYVSKWADESKNPHMSIGRRLSRDWIELAYSQFSGYEASFLCQQFVIRQYNEKRRQYDVVDILPLSQTGVPPVQMDLFQP